MVMFVSLSTPVLVHVHDIIYNDNDNAYNNKPTRVCICSGVETASHAGHCPINLANVG